MLYKDHLETIIGKICITANEHSLLGVSFEEGMQTASVSNTESPVIEETKRQLQHYFAGQLQKFEIPLSITGSDFRKRVLHEVLSIPPGHTITYLQLAHRLGSDRLTRAVASANASNPLLIIIPCHRVVGKNFSMTGYAGEIWRKEWLLNHEGAIRPLF